MLRHFPLSMAAICLGVALSACSRQNDEPSLTKGAESSGEPTGTDQEDSGSSDTSTGPQDPKARKPVVLRRLNRAEYDATLRDLLGEDLGLARSFPSEDPSLGFDNIAQAMSLSPLQIELYERAAWQVAQHWVLPTPVPQEHQHFEAEAMTATVGAECCGGYWNLYANGQVEQRLTVKASGTYALEIRSYGQQMGQEPCKLRVSLDGQAVATLDVPGTETAPDTLKIDIELEANTPHQIALAFVNDAYDPETSQDRNLLIDWMGIQGPASSNLPANPRLRGLLGCDPALRGEETCYHEWVARFGARAFRRPLDAEETAFFADLWTRGTAQGDSFAERVALALTSMLVSPHFLFRVEIDPDPNTPTSRELSGHELAVRLSYFLWSSVPDQELTRLASDDRLLDDKLLLAQVDRMLADPKSKALVHNFAGQWLSIRALDDVFKDVVTFPDYTPSLVKAFKGEREHFFESFVREEKPLTQLLTSSSTYVNAPLARFYGLSDEGLSEDRFELRSLEATPRRGVLGQAGLLSVLGHPENTAPVLRGKWVLEHLLCLIPPPPPDGEEIPPLSHDPNQTMREQLAVHSSNPSCASCHNLMDPIGLALENLDGIGQWRDDDRGLTLDVSGQLPNGTTFVGPTQLAQTVADDPGFSACVTEKLLIYALGRDVTSQDEAEIESILAQAKAQGLSLRALIRAIVQSPLFRRRG